MTGRVRMSAPWAQGWRISCASCDPKQTRRLRSGEARGPLHSFMERNRQMVMRIQNYSEDTVLIEDDEKAAFVTGKITMFEPEKGALTCGYCGRPVTAQNLRRTPDGSEHE